MSDDIMESKNFFWMFSFLIILSLSSCGKERPAKPETSGGKSFPDQAIENFTLAHTNQGEKEWELEADRAEIYEREGKTIVRRLKLKFYDQGKIASVLTAREGEINSPSGDMHVRGNVVVNSEKERIMLKTESLRWDAREKKILTNDFVRQEKGDTIITGWGLESDPELEKLVIKKDVKVIRK
ncbi:LPS export ABC transporter periplasmic protein LptC [bacterium]|nr:LPS export ABC transporter periplasmic protein LptC [bacterium]NIN92416.1 LPS export ABC transporter periplasmic protein LptC [bacterium]NIO18530.1 LPS export ABC transporter periplasmic protein LptC [bacterium]NIO73526.1 LPS export ABC transporter periplasmic protein LptC [bacterium]